MRPEPIHLVILLIVIIVIFGAAKLPSVAKNLGKSMKVFRDEVKDLRTEDQPQDADPKQITQRDVDPDTASPEARAQSEADDLRK